MRFAPPGALTRPDGTRIYKSSVLSLKRAALTLSLANADLSMSPASPAVADIVYQRVDGSSMVVRRVAEFQ